MKKTAYKSASEQESSYWWYVARARILERVFLRYIRAPGPLKILNIGCGSGIISAVFEKYGSVVNADISPEAFACAGRPVPLKICTAAERLSFADSTFDVVMAYDVLEHIPDDRAALREARRVLKEGGALVLTVPAYAWLWGRTDEAGMHKRRYIKKELLMKLAEAGLKVRTATYFNTLLFPLAVVHHMFVKVCSSPKDEFLPRLPGFLNTLLKNIFAAEAGVLTTLGFPYGLSILAVAHKEKP